MYILDNLGVVLFSQGNVHYLLVNDIFCHCCHLEQVYQYFKKRIVVLRKMMTFLRIALHGVTGSEKSMKRPPSELLWTYLMLLSVLSTSKVGLKWCTLHFRSSSNYYCSEFSCCPLNYRPIATILLQVYIVLIFPWLCCEKRDAVATFCY